MKTLFLQKICYNFSEKCDLTVLDPVLQSEGPKMKGCVQVTDEQMIELFWNRSEDAIAQTDAAYGRKLRGLANRILRNQEDAEEVVNDTFMKTWNSIPTNRPRYFYAYIAAICRNLALNLLNWNQAEKRNAQIVAITEEIEQCIPDDAQEREMKGKELEGILNAFLASLPKESRMIFLRRYWFADSVASIAKRYDMTESKVKMQLLRTRNKLNVWLEQEGVQV